MKKIIILITVLCVYKFQSYSQSSINPDSINVKGATIEVEPQYKTGQSAWQKFLEKHLDYDTPRFNEAPPGIYRVKIKFTVFADGHIGNYIRLTKFGYGMEDEVIRVLKKSPKWRPYLKNDQPMDIEKIQTVTFSVSR